MPQPSITNLLVWSGVSLIIVLKAAGTIFCVAAGIVVARFVKWGNR